MGNLTLRQLAYDKILAAIESGQFSKGSVTSEGKLGMMMDMSRTPVRAALQQLELEGYVHIASKHGIIILDSSSDRVGNMLEMIGALVLFSFSIAWNGDRENLLKIAALKKETFLSLDGKPPADPKAMAVFEFHLLDDLISFSHNEEMSKAFQSATSRLFWPQNTRRWRAPYTGESMDIISKFIHSLVFGIEAFTEALLLYLRILKRTWY